MTEQSVKFVNLTPHEVRIYQYYASNKGVLREDVRPLRVFPPCESPVRAKQRETLLAVVDEVPIVALEFGSVDKLPPPEEGTVYICTAVAAEQAARMGRTDVVMIAGSIRDTRGCTVGATKLARPAI